MSDLFRGPKPQAQVTAKNLIDVAETLRQLVIDATLLATSASGPSDKVDAAIGRFDSTNNKLTMMLNNLAGGDGEGRE